MESGAASLEVVALHKRYGARVALDGVGFALNAGEIFGFVGPNGAGKTTTMRIILGVLAADSGEVLWHGRRITAGDRTRIGYMPEERGLYPAVGVMDQLVYFAQLHGVPRQQARELAAGWLHRLGVEGRGADQLQRLSHGNQQRVELVAALIHNPALLILDEPFSGLDPVAADAMATVLRQLAAEGTPVLFSSHQLELVEELCHRIGIINGGRMLATGTVGELQRGDGDRYWVDAPGATDGWASLVPGAVVLQRDGSRYLVGLAAGNDEQPLLRAALATGPVRDFRRDTARLSELFRHVIAGEAQ